MNATSYNQKVDALGMRGYPTVASVELTYRCNARCGYCYVAREPARPEMPLEKARYVFDKLHDAGVLNLVVTGGEPFIRDDILRIVGHVCENDFFGLIINTNGTLLTAAHLDFLIAHRARITNVKFSAFSHDPGVNDRYLGVDGATGRILAAAETLMTGGVKVMASVAVIDVNARSFMDTVAFYEQRGFEVIVTPFKVVAGPDHRSCMLPSLHPDLYRDYFAALPRSQVERYKRELTMKTQEPPGTHRELCPGRLTTVNVAPDGAITPCAAFRSLTVGNIFDPRPLHDILVSSEAYRRMRDMDKMSITKCRECRYVNFCDICLARVHCESGTFDAPDRQMCDYVQALDELTL